jgi:hypothetical protein
LGCQNSFLEAHWKKVKGNKCPALSISCFTKQAVSSCNYSLIFMAADRFKLQTKKHPLLKISLPFLVFSMYHMVLDQNKALGENL